uniref:Uncharacterized protein n=1 Tax=Tanacetum cinerariifolium TaxID=118510 RepID=A0A699HRG4_TANCI|nr:hypothetical protein [Tanacetum cinerariifolium]
MVPGLAGGEWWRACRISGSGGEGSKNGGEGGVESGGKNGLNSNSNLNRGREMVLFGTGPQGDILLLQVKSPSDTALTN